MITCQCAEAMPTYASQSSYLTPIPSANIERGVIPLDSLPADWWNWLWNSITLNEGRIVQFINSVFSEINSVLSAAGVTPSTASTTDLKTAIQKLATTVATSAVPGSVLSSTLSGKLRVIADGTASINGLGTPNQLKTTSKEVVSAINEVLALAQGKAPTSHASSDTTFGVGTTRQYGHVKVTEGCGLAISCGTISLNAPGYNCTGTVTAVCFNGTKYTPSGGVVSFSASGANCTGTVTAVCYNGTRYTPSDGVVNLGNAPSGFPGYGTAICPLNGNLCCASSAGTSSLVARADHVHAMPNCISSSNSNYIHVGPSYVSLRTAYVYAGNYDACLALVMKPSHIRIMPYFSGTYAKYSMYFIPNCNMTLTQLHCALGGGNNAIGVSLCMCGSCISYPFAVIEGLLWSNDGCVVNIFYRPGIDSKEHCAITLTPPQSGSCLYCMRGILTVFR